MGPPTSLRGWRAAALLCVALLQAACATGGRHTTACGLDAATHAEVSQLVASIVERGHAPGVVADIRCDGQPWLAVSAGQADAAKQRPMRADSLFRIYSMTKPVTSVAVLMLADEGRLSLDDPVARHLPEFAGARVYAGERDGKLESTVPLRPLTVRDLLRHSAGIPYLAPVPHPVLRRYVERGIDNGSGMRIVPSDGSAPVDSLAELSRRIASIPLLHEPGEKYTYGNATDVLGRLVEVVAGRPFGAVLDERLFKRLDMTDTGFRVGADALPRLTAAYSAPSQRPGDGGVLNAGALAGLAPSKLTPVDASDATSVFAQARPVAFGGAGLVSSAADYHCFMSLLLNQGTAGGQRLLRAETVSAMTRNQLDSAALASSALSRQGLGFGLGVAVVMDPARAPAAASKDSVFWGGAASTYFWVDPQRRISGVLMTQVFGGDVAPYFVALVNLVGRGATP
jgi:CubicO group peptidase (beta-lactamase class C family)